MISNKKGQYVQLILTVVLLVAFLLVSVFVYQAFSIFNDEFQLDDTFSNESQETVQNLTTSYPSLFDGIGVLVLVGLWILSLVIAYNSDSNPLMVLIALFIIGALGFTAMVFSNVWDEVYDSEESSSFAVSFPMMTFIMQNYLLVVVVMGFSVLLVGLRGGF